jgi:hypothetical protein
MLPKSSNKDAAPEQLDATLLEIQRAADQLACFGWVQPVAQSDLAASHAIVGEARCARAEGDAFLKWMHSLLSVETAYLSTKVR